MTVPLANSSKATPEFHGSLVRTIVIWLLIFSLVPVLLMGTVTYIRSQSVLKSQISNQIQVVVDSYSEDLVSYANVRVAIMENLVGNRDLFAATSRLLNSVPDSTAYITTREQLRALMNNVMTSPAGTMFDEMSFVDPDGVVIASTRTDRLGVSFNQISGAPNLLGSTQTQLIFHPSMTFPYDMVLFTSRAYTAPDETGRSLTLIGVSKAPTPQNALISASKFFPGSHPYFFNQGNMVIGLNVNNQMIGFEDNHAQLDPLHAIITANGGTGFHDYVSYGNQRVLSYGRWLPKINMGLALEVPSALIDNQINYLGPINLLILAAALLFTTTMVGFGTSRMVRPVTDLVKRVGAFAQGDWSQRAKVNRRDEIGHLAYSFNLMAEELARMYRSLESKVEERNKQLLTASEVAQVATSAGSRQDILKRTVDLLVERFGYEYACIYLLDSTSSYFTSRAVSGGLSEHLAEKAIDSRIRVASMFGWVISNNQERIFSIDMKDSGDAEDLILGARSGIAVPISAGGQVLGILDVQSTQDSAFDEETATVLKMLARQLANGLQNIHLVENAQVDLHETSLLYQASRQVTRATNREEVWSITSQALVQAGYLGMILRASEGQLKAAAVVDPGAKEGEKVPTIIVTLQRILANLGQQGFLIFDNLNQPSEYYPILSYFNQRSCTSVAIIPIWIGGQLEQIFALGSRKDTVFTGSSLQPFLNLTEVVANTEERFDVLKTLEANVTDLSTIATVSQAISVETNLQVVYKLIHDQITSIAGGTLGFYIALYDPETELIEFPYIYERGEKISVEPIHLGQGLTSVLIKRREPLLLSHNAVQQAAALGAKIMGEPARSWLGVPLILGSQVIGGMVVEDTETDGRFTERELTLFNALAPQIAVAIRNAQLLNEMADALKAYDQERFLFNSLLDNTPEVVYFKDTEGHYMRISQAYAAMLHLSSIDELVGKTDVEYAPDRPQAVGIHQMDMETIVSGQPIIGQVITIRMPDGSESWVSSSRLPLRDNDNQVTGLLTINHDITEMKTAEHLSQQRAQQLRTAAEIARDTSGTLNLEELLVNAVNLVRERFGFYHSSIFLLDPLKQYAILRESTGEAGRALKEAGHKLAVGSQSLVGRATATGESMVVNDVSKDPNYYPNPLLPMTHSELVIPLKVGNRVVGALDVQSVEVNPYSVENINILTILADQLAVAIINADLFAETQENIAKHRFLHQITTAAAACSSADEALLTTVEGLQTALGSDRVAAYLLSQQNVLEVHASAGFENVDLSQQNFALGESTVGLAALGRHPVLVQDTLADTRYSTSDESIRSQLAIPILYNDRAVGVLCMESKQVAAFSENDQEIMGSLGSTLGAILANAQLMNQVSQQMEQQKILFEITSRIRRSTDIETILETSARELCTALRAQGAHIRIIADENAVAPASDTRVKIDPPDDNRQSSHGKISNRGNGNGNGNGSHSNGSNGNGSNGNGYHKETDL